MPVAWTSRCSHAPRWGARRMPLSVLAAGTLRTEEPGENTIGVWSGEGVCHLTKFAAIASPRKWREASFSLRSGWEGEAEILEISAACDCNGGYLRACHARPEIWAGVPVRRQMAQVPTLQRNHAMRFRLLRCRRFSEFRGGANGLLEAGVLRLPGEFIRRIRI